MKQIYFLMFIKLLDNTFVHSNWLFTLALFE